MREADDYLAKLRRMRAQTAESLATWKSGNMHFGEIRDGQHVDITADWVATLERRLVEDDRVIAACEKMIEAAARA